MRRQYFFEMVLRLISFSVRVINLAYLAGDVSSFSGREESVFFFFLTFSTHLVKIRNLFSSSTLSSHLGVGEQWGCQKQKT